MNLSCLMLGKLEPFLLQYLIFKPLGTGCTLFSLLSLILWAYFKALTISVLMLLSECCLWSLIFMSGMYSQGFIFCEKVKERLCSQDDYQAFLKCLHIYSNGIIKRNDLQNLVSLCLLQQFNNISKVKHCLLTC